MSNKKVTELPVATTVAPTDLLLVVQGGTTKQVSQDTVAAAVAGSTQLAATFQPLIPQLEAVPFLREGDSYDDGSQGADQASRPGARLAIRHNMGTVTKTSVAGTRTDQALARVISNGFYNRRGLILLADLAINDGAQMGNTTPGINTTREAFRSLLACLSSQSIPSLSTPALRFSSGWSAGVSSTAGAYVDIAFTTASAFVLLAFTTGAGGTATIKNTSGATVATVATGGYSQTFTGAVKLTGSAGTTTTYRLSVTTGPVGIVGIAAQSPTPALIVWDKAGSLPALNDATRNAYQVAMTTVLTDFPNVLPVDMGTGWDAASMISEDNTHRNDKGNQYALVQIETAIRAYIAPRGYYQGLNRISVSGGGAATYTDPNPIYTSPSATPPTAPTALAVTGTADTTAALTWTASSSDSGATITGHVVQYRITGSGSWSTFGGAIPGTATGISVTGLTATTQYDFRVAAINSAGTGSYSSTATGTTTTPVTTYVADNLTAKADGPLGVTSTGAIAWTFPTGASFSMAGGKVQLTAAATVPYDAVVDDGQYNGTLTCGSNSNQGGLVFRTSGAGDTTGYIIWRNGSNYVLSKRTGSNSYTQLAATSGLTPNFGDVLKVVMTGDATSSTFTVYVNGAQAFAPVVDSSSPYVGTKHGLWSLSSSAASAWQGTFSHTSALA